MLAQLLLSRSDCWWMLFCFFCNSGSLLSSDTEPTRSEGGETSSKEKEDNLPQRESAVFAGGCFWCVESDFERTPGVVEVISGYSGGRTKNPTYDDYASGGHREVVFVIYDPTQVSYAGLVERLIKNVDPINKIGQFEDKGRQYSPAIYYNNEAEQLAAQRVIAAINEMKVFRGKLNVALEKRQAFWPAEAYHQNYHLTHASKYRYYRMASGRDAYVLRHWGARADKIELDGGLPAQSSNAALPTNPAISSNLEQATSPKDATGDSRPSTPLSSDVSSPDRPAWTQFQKPSEVELRKQLTKLQYGVTQHDETEPAFGNAYWNNHKVGIYVDILSGEPLFSSAAKFESGTGWPSFVAPIDQQAVIYKTDNELDYTRIEVRSRYGNSHLGHMFNDGPVTRGGKRFCMNSSAMKFIPKEEMAEQGYAEYLPLVY